MAGMTALGPMTVISMDGRPNSRQEIVLRWVWRIALGCLSTLVVVLGVFVAFDDVYTSGSDFGYNLGLVGGLMMLSLLLYPLRKRIRALDHLGDMTTWFRYHMFFGIAGPVLVLFHSTFRTNSMNGSMALYAMLLVAFSGVVGRYFYRHVHQGLYGRKLTLADARSEIKNSVANLDSVFALQPDIEIRLRQFYEDTFSPLDSVSKRIYRFLTLRRKAKLLSGEIRRDAKQALKKLGAEKRLPRFELVLNYRLARAQIDSYLDAVVQAGQLSFWERAFSLWHLIHVPFLYLLVLSGIVHVVAVHMY